MSILNIVFLGAIAGFTIFLGLPVARLKSVGAGAKTFLSMLAAGVLLFLLVDVTAKMLEPIQESLASSEKHPENLPGGVLDLALLVGGVLLGLVGIMLFSDSLVNKDRAKDAPRREAKPESLSMIIAIGIGAHNLSEGLAIGQAAVAGSLSLAWILIVGFGLHNMTEGFGIAGPLSGTQVSWKYLSALGVIGGGPTFLGTVLGITLHSEGLFIFSLAFAAGAIIYVVTELVGSNRSSSKVAMAWGLFAGFTLGLGTDMILTIGGA
jgi:zinc transporter, ZIP family